MGIGNDISPRYKSQKKTSTDVKIHIPEESAKPIPEVIELPEATEPTTTHNDFFPPETHSRKERPVGPHKKSPILIYILVILVLGLIGVAVYQNFDRITGLFNKSADKVDDTNTAAAVTQPTTNTTSTTTTDQSTVTQPTETTAQAATPVIDKKSFSIRVSNGNGLKGSADKVADILNTAGFNVVSTGNASSYTYKTTIIYYQPGKSAEAELVKEALSARSVSTSESATLKSYNILVIVGAK